ncbi:MAG: YgiQ family radical SAM protein, partial [Deltaproteobacteria bacterium]|nr:YgiQ family radical SAM protein [Deltaproteobacteria bacterium]
MPETKAITQTPSFIPTTPKEVSDLGWDGVDIILVTGDTYVDSSHMGVAVIGRVLMAEGYRVGVIAQPDVQGSEDITRLGAPKLFWGVTGGAVDSMVANYTASGKRRKRDDLTPGGINTRRPDRAVIAYSNLIRRYFKDHPYIVIGGIEASLRRISHYDAWANSVRRSILFDAKADVLVYGMGETSTLALAGKIRRGKPITGIRGICYISRDVPAPDTQFPSPDMELPAHEAVSENKNRFARMFRAFYENADPVTGKRLYQKQDTRYLIQNPPALPLSPEALDRVYELSYSRDVHPFYKKWGSVTALDTIRFSLTTHRGCYGECRFCAITVHQGRHVSSRSEASILREARGFLRHPRFKGIISNVGGPTANMYGIECERKKTQGACQDKGCLFPEPCKHLPVHHGRQMKLLQTLSQVSGVRKVFVGSGIRYDLILRDRKTGRAYLEKILRHHVSGQLKIAPEHVADAVLNLMGKPGSQRLEEFVGLFNRLKQKIGGNIFLTYYLMAAHPG